MVAKSGKNVLPYLGVSQEFFPNNPNRIFVKMKYLEKYANSLIFNDYNIIPVKTGEKRSLIKNWTEKEFNSLKEIKNAISEHEFETHQGIGILCNKDVIGIDIDVYNAAIVNEIKQWLKNIYGEALLFRYGNRPKVLIPFRYIGKLAGKRQSPKYKDPTTLKDGKPTEHMIEVLRGGAQFVAYNTLANGGKYEWEQETAQGIVNKSLIDVPVSELPVIDDKTINDLFMVFNEICEEYGLNSTAKSVLVEDEDVFGSDVPKVQMTNAQIMEVLYELDRYQPDFKDDELHWREVGMALWHQFDGDTDGYNMWIEWSKTSTHFNQKDHDKGIHWKRWKSFDPDKGNKIPITFRSIIYRLDEAKYDVADNAYRDFKQGFHKVTSLREIDHLCKKIKQTDMPRKYREMLVIQALEAYKRIGEKPPTMAKMRPELEYDYSNGIIPHWCKNWVYASDYEKFVNVVTKKEKSKFSFDAAYTRYLQEANGIASDVALNTYKIKNVDATMYAPPEGLFIQHEGKTYLNTYRDDLIPEIPETLTEQQQWGVDVFRRHVMEHLLADKRDAELFMSWLASQVQNVGRKIGWACVLQGTQGDGKSTIGYIMRHVMGTTNVRIIGNKAIQGDFADWVTGYALGVIEEVSITGKKSHELINDLKQYITNDIVDLHKKFRDAESVLHFSNYLFLTNEEFGIPVDESDRRFFILNSRWQNRQDLEAFIKDNPKYYGDLYYVRTNPVIFAGAIRKFLLEYELCDEFKTAVLAPNNEAKMKVIQGLRDQVFVDLERELDTSNVLGCNRELFSITKFAKENLELSEHPRYRNRWKHIMSSLGMYPIRGTVSLGKTGINDQYTTKHTFYSNDPKKWTKDGKLNGYINHIKVKRDIGDQFYLDMDERGQDDDEVWNDNPYSLDNL